MLFKKRKTDAPFIKEASLSGDDTAEEEEVDGVDAGAVDSKPPAKSEGKEDEDIAKVADALLTPMGSGEKEAAEKIDVIVQPVELEKLAIDDEPVDITLEKTDEEAAVKEENGAGGLMGDLFDEEEEEENSPIGSLIATLPDITMEELLTQTQELTEIMSEWQK
ncbi:hypothetical protein ACFLYE_00360 [Chloroflexota bacterium]